jgi:CheY-like chemotaxis protein
MLALKGYKVIGSAFDGCECIDKLNSGNSSNGSKKKNSIDPDFILMDNNMPKKTGLEATKELLKAHPELKIILISGDPSIQNEALLAGAVSFIQKPFEINTLFNTIEQLLTIAK